MQEGSIADLLNELEASEERSGEVSGERRDAEPRAARSSSSGRRSSSRRRGHGRRRRKGKRTRQQLLRNWLIVFGVLVLLLGAAYALVVTALNGIDRISIAPDPSLERPAAAAVEPGESAPINVLLLGSDSREPRDVGADGQQLRGFRTDAMLLAQLSPDRKNLTVMSIMRDNWVEIQGMGEAKINAASSYGGVSLTVNAVEHFIDSRIDHVALIDFEAFKGLTDAVGGVTVHNDIAWEAQNGGGDFTFEQGQIDLDGEQALSFVRERYAFADGDYQRVRNQQIYVKALMGKLLSGETLSNPGRVTDVFMAMRPYLTIDDGLNLPTMVWLGAESRGLRQANIRMFTSPTLGTGTSADGQSIVLPDWEAMEAVREAVREGTLHEYAASLG